MKIYKTVILSITLIIPVIIYCSALHADDLGRLFTSPQERAMLEKIRNTPPEPEIEQTIEIPELDEIQVNTPLTIENITVSGLVYRKDGKSTAWVNKGNSYDMNYNLQSYHISNEKISPDNVVISINEIEKEIELKVGETYESNIDEIRDVLDEFPKENIVIP